MPGRPPKRSGRKKKALIVQRVTPQEDGVQRSAIVPHKHCFNCGVSITTDKDICSDACQAEWDRMLKRKKLMTYLPFIGIALLILFYILISSS
ncbi:MAG: DUF2116 family Zn-ribbon domain-containing protein [Candidatus Thermoplasmatota archaeon]|nr:DUF2116 family Zn-ribbon domain-containing protein [Candidatus Thermoplasmatota archaeon]